MIDIVHVIPSMSGNFKNTLINLRGINETPLSLKRTGCLVLSYTFIRVAISRLVSFVKLILNMPVSNITEAPMLTKS